MDIDSDSDSAGDNDSDYLNALSASEMIGEIQSRVDHVTDALFFVNKNTTFSDSDQAQRQ